MTMKRMTRWATAMTVTGAFVIGGASLAMSQQEEPQGRRPRPGMRGPGMQGPDGRDAPNEFPVACKSDVARFDG